MGWIKKLIKFLSGRKETESQGFITIGEVIPREIKIKLYEMVS